MGLVYANLCLADKSFVRVLAKDLLTYLNSWILHGGDSSQENV